MNRKVLKVISIVLMLTLAFSMVATQVLAAVELTPSTDLLTGTAQDSVTTPVQNVVATAIKVIQIVGMAIAVIMLVMIAIKYMTAAPQDKADFKKSATAYIVGAVLLFAASGILEIVKNFANTIGK